MTEDTHAIIERLLHKHLPRSRGMKLTPETTMHGDLFGNDIDILCVIMGAEDELDIDVDDDEAERIKTVGDLFTLVDGKLKVPG